MILLPASIWDAALAALRTPPHDREQVAFLDGLELGEDAVVTTLTIPEAEQAHGHYAISAHEMTRAGLHLRELGLIRIAQIHTHPGSWTGHSGHDDEFAYSQADGAVSIVAPHFAGTAPGLGDCSVHVRRETGWKKLSAKKRKRTIKIVPSLIDLRA